MTICGLESGIRIELLEGIHRHEKYLYIFSLQSLFYFAVELFIRLTRFCSRVEDAVIPRCTFGRNMLDCNIFCRDKSHRVINRVIIWRCKNVFSAGADCSWALGP